LIIAAAGFYNIQWLVPGIVILVVSLVYYSSLKKFYFSRYLSSPSLNSV
jgi:hypothetical protein